MREARFEDRVDAGRRLSSLLRPLAEEDVVVLGVPQGGVHVAAIVAVFLATPLDLLVVRRLVAPGPPERSVGALAEDGVVLFDDVAVAESELSAGDLRDIALHEQSVLEERVATLRRRRPRLPVEGSTVLIVDDGLSTGTTARAAAVQARSRGATRVIVAVPVGPPDAAARVPEADEVICLVAPADFTGIADYYDDLAPITDEFIVRLVAQSR